jgi:hypothetical protein
MVAQASPRRPLISVQAPFTPYTRSAAARILGLTPQLINQVQEWTLVVWVRFTHGSPRFISKNAFRADFLATRRAGAKLVNIQPVSMFSYIAHNIENGHAYNLKCEPGLGSVCDCEDYRRQFEVYGKALCKHRIALTEFLSNLHA